VKLEIEINRSNVERTNGMSGRFKGFPHIDGNQPGTACHAVRAQPPYRETKA
jgi:hypothetical protein